MKKPSEKKTRFEVSEAELERMRNGKIKRLRRPKTQGVPRLCENRELPKVLDADIAGLEQLSKDLDRTRKKILNVIITDFPSATEKDDGERWTFSRLREACGRAGMLEDRNKQAEFFRTISNPEFNQVVKTVGTALVGMYVVPLMAKQIELAMNGSQAALDRLLEITGLKQSKYDFYLQRVALNKTDINVEGDLNLEGKSDAELEKMAASFGDIPEAEATVS